MSLTFEQAAEQLGKMADRVETHMARGMSFGLERFVREAAVVETVKHGVGRRLWGNRRAGAFAMFKREPIRLDGGRVRTVVLVKGLPGLAETGGVTQDHLIQARGANLAGQAARAFKKGKLEKGVALASRGARAGQLLGLTVRGRRLAAPWIQHPGSRIAKNPVVAAALDKNGAKVAAEIAKSIDGLIALVQRGG
jgi:hypothetical protein